MIDKPALSCYFTANCKSAGLRKTNDMFTLGIILGAIAYLNIGYHWGRVSLKAWHKKKRSVAGFLCFPVSYIDNDIGGLDPSSMKIPIQEYEANTYTSLMAFVWPGKLLWNLFTTTSIPVLCGGYVIGKNILKLVTNPRALFHKPSIKQLTDKPTQELPAPQPAEPEPSPDQFDIHEYQRLKEQRDRIDERLKTLDAHPDKKKILAMPKRP